MMNYSDEDSGKSNHNVEASPPKKIFKILSIDGGGIRGILPARLLCEIEDELERNGIKDTSLYKYFDMICGTSTGGIIAIGLALGMSAKDILMLYKNNASKIFNGGMMWPRWLFKSRHDNDVLYNLLKQTFSPYSSDGQTRLGHAKTRLCIPTYNAETGQAYVYKTAHQEHLIRDYQIPAHDVAMSTAAAPTFFRPHSFTYTNQGSPIEIETSKNIDGGVISNNPTLIGLIEAHSALNVPYENIKILSIGTGQTQYSDNSKKGGFGLGYWLWKARLLDMIFSAQSQNIDNLVKIINRGIGDLGEARFYYKRVQYLFRSGESIDLDSLDKYEHDKLERIACQCYKEHGVAILEHFFSQPANTFLTFKPLR